MARNSAWAGSYKPNQRPFVTIAPDVYVAFQGSTTAVGCGECQRKVDFNDYITSVSTESSIDSPPGSATISMTIPDNDINQFYIENRLLIVPMMEVEVFAKGYYLVGGVPKYYRIFWGLVSSVSTSWSSGTTTVNISCKDILRWWELTQVVINPAFVDNMGSSAGPYQIYQNQLAGLNPYAVIIQLARESMGDFSFTTGSFLSFTPEKNGAEKPYSAGMLGDIMAYWQAKFNNIWSSLVLYGTTGNIFLAEKFSDRTRSPASLSVEVLKQEWADRQNYSQESLAFQQDVGNTAAYKIDFPRAGEVSFFQTEAQTKLAIAQEARNQIGFEFFCDTNGDIVFKPPFYNLNVLPNKPVSWIQNFELIEDSLNDSESEVVTHITASGNAFGGIMDWGLNDDITTPNTGVYDYHLLKQYGWRKHEFPVSWAGNPRRLFYHCLDMLDRINSKRQNGSATVPMRPELRLGFPVYIEKYDSFFYVNTISHNFSVGSSATTALSLTSRRSKFLAPLNIGTLETTGNTVSYTQERVKSPAKGKDAKQVEIDSTPKQVNIPIYKASFPNNTGDTSGATNQNTPARPVVVRDPTTGKLLGYPNVVMVFRTTLNGQKLSQLMEEVAVQKKQAKNREQQNKEASGRYASMSKLQSEIIDLIQTNKNNQLKASIRAHRYEAGASNAGVYDYAWDKSGTIRQITIIPLEAYQTNAPEPVSTSTDDQEKQAKDAAALEQSQKKIAAVRLRYKEAQRKATSKLGEFKKAVTDLGVKYVSERETEAAVSTGAGIIITLKNSPDKTNPIKVTYPPDKVAAYTAVLGLERQLAPLQAEATKIKGELDSLTGGYGGNTLVKGSVIVRPVSDEFGFEVIGHYRYGRGVVFDASTGQTEIQNPTSQQGRANRIGIQFASTGSLTTDTSIGSGAAPINYAKSLETMQPSDWITGAVFSGVKNDNNDGQNPSVKINSVTSQSTYDSMRTGANVVTINADNISNSRAAREILELSPTVSNGILDSAIDDCACGLGRPNWLGILPLNVVKSIIQPRFSYPFKTAVGATEATIERSPFKGIFKSATQQDQEGPNGTYDITNNVSEMIGNVQPGSFFQALNLYLADNFISSYRNSGPDGPAGQAKRDKEYTQGTTPAYWPDSGPGRDAANQRRYSFGNPNDYGPSLFSQAAAGDVDAIKALANKPNWKFGLTQEALDRPLNKPPQYDQTVPNFNALINPTVFVNSATNQPTNPLDPAYPPK